MPKITPFLWFDKQAEQAAKFYTSVFKGSKILETTRHSKGSGGKPGSVMLVKFQLQGREFTAFNGGPEFTFSHAISFVVHCKTQAEVDYYWRRLSSGGKEVQCGWLVDKFGLSWQIVPDILLQYLSGKDAAKAGRAMAATMKMVKLDIRALKRAASA